MSPTTRIRSTTRIKHAAQPESRPLLNGPGPLDGKPVGLLRKIGGVAVALVVFGVALAFSVMFLAVIATLALCAGIYFWWKTRELRKASTWLPVQAWVAGTK